MTDATANPGLSHETKFLPRPPVSLLDEGVFEGYASLFDVPDLGRDVVAPGAFAESLARRGAAGIRMLWQHDPAQPIGRWLSLAEDARGLRVRGRLNLSVRRAREIAAMLAEGDIDGLSIGFRTVEARSERGTRLRRLIKVDLWEVSVVTFPLLPGARLATSGRPLLPPDPIARAMHRATRRVSATLNRTRTP